MMSSVCVGSCGRLKASNIQFKIIEAIGATSKIRYRYTHEEAIVEAAEAAAGEWDQADPAHDDPPGGDEGAIGGVVPLAVVDGADAVELECHGRREALSLFELR